MNLGENLIRSVSGSVDKAILCVKKPIPGKKRVPILDKTDTNNPKLLGFKMDFEMGGKNPRVITASQLQERLAREVKTKKSRSVWIDKKIKDTAGNKKEYLSFGKTIENTIKDSGYHILRVKYNPSKINIDARVGSFIQQGPGGEAANGRTQLNIMPPQTFMNFEIILDEENAQDAFMFDKGTNLTAGAVVSDVAGAVKNGITEEGYTVRPMVEALLGILTQAETRKVVFFWSEMVFAGEVVSIDARYTMFNPLGNPIRAVVRFSIRQDGTEDENNSSSYWSKAFDNLESSSNWQGKVGNLLNFR